MNDVSQYIGPPNDEIELDIFNFRLSSARRNLQAMDLFVDLLHSRNRYLSSLRRELVGADSQIADKLRRASGQIRYIQTTLNDEKPDKNVIADSAKHAGNYLKELTELFEAARRKAELIWVLQLDPSAMAPSKDEFNKKIRASTRKLDKIEGGPKSLDSWRDLKGIGSLWAEYLDYLVGLSLRHDGLDNGICDIADAMIGELQRCSTSLTALAIPGREGCMGTLPKIVYLRFPEWTVWSLPLAAHELWLIAESGGAPISTTFYDRAERYLSVPDENNVEKKMNSPYGRWTEDGQVKQELKPFLADAFATYTIGPAYAWSSLLLDLDPTMQHDQLRAHTILNALEHLKGNSTTYEADLKELNEVWHRATEQTSGSALVTPDDSKEKDFLIKKKDYLTWTSFLLDDLKGTQKHLRGIQKLAFPTDVWDAREQWVSILRDGPPEQDGADTRKWLLGQLAVATPTMSIRFALNAAWQARIERPEAALEIAERCYLLCKTMEPSASIPPAPDASTGEWVNSF